jgi:hypothetical protein
MGKLLVLRRLLEAEERLPRASRGPTRRNGGSCPSALSDNRSTSAGGLLLGPPGGSRPLWLAGGPRARPGLSATRCRAGAVATTGGQGSDRGGLLAPVRLLGWAEHWQGLEPM